MRPYVPTSTERRLSELLLLVAWESLGESWRMVSFQLFPFGDSDLQVFWEVEHVSGYKERKNDRFPPSHQQEIRALVLGALDQQFRDSPHINGIWIHLTPLGIVGVD